MATYLVNNIFISHSSKINILKLKSAHAIT